VFSLIKLQISYVHVLQLQTPEPLRYL
jgi:hypothetical protein